MTEEAEGMRQILTIIVVAFSLAGLIFTVILVHWFLSIGRMMNFGPPMPVYMPPPPVPDMPDSLLPEVQTAIVADRTRKWREAGSPLPGTPAWNAWKGKP